MKVYEFTQDGSKYKFAMEVFEGYIIIMSPGINQHIINYAQKVVGKFNRFILIYKTNNLTELSYIELDRNDRISKRLPASIERLPPRVVIRLKTLQHEELI